MKKLIILLLFISFFGYGQKMVNIEGKYYFFQRPAKINYEKVKKKDKIVVYNNTGYYLQYIGFYENYDTILTCAIYKSKGYIYPIILERREIDRFRDRKKNR